MSGCDLIPSALRAVYALVTLLIAASGTSSTKLARMASWGPSEPNTTVTSPGSVGVVFTVLFCIVSIVSVALRFYSRRINDVLLGPDDWWSLISLVRLVCRVGTVMILENEPILESVNTDFLGRRSSFLAWLLQCLLVGRLPVYATSLASPLIAISSRVLFRTRTPRLQAGGKPSGRVWQSDAAILFLPIPSVRGRLLYSIKHHV